jgi:hypothetical protein
MDIFQNCPGQSPFRSIGGEVRRDDGILDAVRVVGVCSVEEVVLKIKRVGPGIGLSCGRYGKAKCHKQENYK